MSTGLPTEQRIRIPTGITRDELHQILDLARWAPSGDNLQPGRVRTTDDGERLDVMMDSTQPPAFLDVNLEASRIAIGAFVESVRLAAASMSIDGDVELLPQSTIGAPWASIGFGRGRTERPEAIAGVLTERVTNRRRYEPGSTTDQELRQIADAASGTEGVDVQFLTREEELGTVAEAVGISDRVRMRHRQCHHEFHEKVRWSEQQARETRDGFYVKTFEIRSHEALLLRLTRAYPVLRTVDALTGMSRIAAAVARAQVQASGAVGIVCTSSRDPAQMMRVGVALQRMWLTATMLGLAFQVLAVAPIFVRRLALGGEGFSDAARKKIETVRQILQSVCGNSQPEEIALFFRVGRAAPPSARTYRLSAEELFA